MKDVLTAVLTDPAARSSSALPKIAASSAETFTPWANE